jgi:hypothetical protein
MRRRDRIVRDREKRMCWSTKGGWERKKEIEKNRLRNDLRQTMTNDTRVVENDRLERRYLQRRRIFYRLPTERATPPNTRHHRTRYTTERATPPNALPPPKLKSTRSTFLHRSGNSIYTTSQMICEYPVPFCRKIC